MTWAICLSGLAILDLVYSYNAILNKKHRGEKNEGNNTPLHFILTKAHRAAVSMIAKGSIVARVLPPSCALKMYCCKGIDENEVLLHEYSQSAILHALHYGRAFPDRRHQGPHPYP